MKPIVSSASYVVLVATCIDPILALSYAALWNRLLTSTRPFMFMFRQLSQLQWLCQSWTSWPSQHLDTEIQLFDKCQGNWWSIKPARKLYLPSCCGKLYMSSLHGVIELRSRIRHREIENLVQCTGGNNYKYSLPNLLQGQAKGRLTLGAKFETLWNDFLSAWSWGQHSKVYRTTKNNQLLLLEKKLWAFESIGVGKREQIHFLTNSTL